MLAGPNPLPNGRLSTPCPRLKGLKHPENRAKERRRVSSPSLGGFILILSALQIPLCGHIRKRRLRTSGGGSSPPVSARLLPQELRHPRAARKTDASRFMKKFYFSFLKLASVFVEVRDDAGSNLRLKTVSARFIRVAEESLVYIQMLTDRITAALKRSNRIEGPAPPESHTGVLLQGFRPRPPQHTRNKVTPTQSLPFISSSN